MRVNGLSANKITSRASSDKGVVVVRGHSVSHLGTEPKERQPRNGKIVSEVACQIFIPIRIQRVHTDWTEYRESQQIHHLPGRLHQGLDGNHRT